MKQKRLPGPVGASCLTCKRRRKKCDRGRPTCERCAQVGYECLGYDHLQRRAMGVGPSSNSSHAESVDDKSTWSAGLGYACNPPPPEASTYGLDISSPYSNLDTCGSVLGSKTPLSDPRSLLDPRSPRLLPPANNQGWGVTRLPTSPFSGELEDQFNASLSATSSRDCLITPIEPRIARDLSTLPSDARQAITFVLSQYERLLSVIYFTPKHQQIIHIRGIVVDRLQESSITRCAVYLGARLVQSRLDRTCAQHHSSFTKSVEQFEQKLLLVSSRAAAAPDEVQHRLHGFLEAAFLKMRLSSGSLAYQQLRNAAPTFLQLVYSYPGLWPNPRGPPIASLAHVISSTRYEFGHFALMDIVCAMAYGLPQVIDYDTSAPPMHVRLHPVEWIHACPTEFIICLAQINQRRSTNYISHDWHLIEQRLLSFKPSLSHVADLESWKVVARLAVVESWRQVLLIYLYMAVCGVASDDPRVQSAVRQTFQLLKTIRRQDPPKINVHFIFQYLIAGACTRIEKQRAYVRERLLDTYDSEMWLLPGSEFVPVLDHLWHGAAANGQAFKWRDYVFSRQTTLPVLI